jgi:hypothetical protein
MTVQELITVLATADKDSQVVFLIKEGESSEPFYLKTEKATLEEEDHYRLDDFVMKESEVREDPDFVSIQKSLIEGDLELFYEAGTVLISVGVSE